MPANNMLAKSKEQRRLAKSAPDSYDNDMRFGHALRDDAPAILDALDFRPGDADRLLDFMEYIGENCESPEEYAYLEMLKRLHGMARKMEQEDKR